MLLSMLFKVLRRVCVLSWNIGHWRRKWEVDSILEPQLNILKRGIFSAGLVAYDDVFSDINLKRYCGLLLLKIL